MDEDIIAQLIEENDRLRKELAEENEITDILDERVKNLEYENEMLITNIESFMKRLSVIPLLCRATHEPYLEEFKDSHADILAAPLGLPLPLDM
jgi:hypothetical protein